jgi:hypothetical protein
MKIRWSSLFFGSFAHNFQIKLSIHASNFNSRFVSMSELELFLLTGGLDSKLQHYGPCKNSWKKSKTSYSDRSGHIEGDVMQSHEQKKKVKKSKKPRFHGQNKLFFENSTLQPLGSINHMARCRSSLENTWKMSLILVCNKNLPRAHTESELCVLGVHGKLVKYLVYSSKRKNWKKVIFLHTSCPNNNWPIFGLKEF